MLKGGLVPLISSEVSGLIYHTATTNQLRLGGRTYPRVGGYVLDVSEYPLDETYLTIAAISTENLSRVSWRVGVNDLSITREFKPQVVTEHKGYIYSVHIFDLSKVVRGGRIYDLTISCDSAKPLLVDSVELIGIRRYPKVVTEVTYSSGCVLVNPSGSYLMSYNSGFNGTTAVSALLNVPSKSAVVDIVINERPVKSLSNYLGPASIYLSVDEPAGKHSLAVRYRSSYGGYHSGILALYSLLKHKANKRGPKVCPVINEVRDLGREYKISVTLRNEGDMACENLLVTVLSGGNVVFRDLIKSIRPGEEVSREHIISKGKVRRSIVLRAAYRGLYGQELSEARHQVALAEA